jgi:hypothetical protein
VTTIILKFCVGIRKGDCFDSFASFHLAFVNYCDSKKHPTRCRSSHKLDDDRTDRFVYKDALFTCVHYGKPRPSKATTCRPHQTRLPIECPMKLRLLLKRSEEGGEDFVLQVQ